jgi:hypothetical protein
MLDYIAEHGVKHGIDYVMKINKDLTMGFVQPHPIISDWQQPSGPPCDTDIQSDHSCLNLMEDWTYIAGQDHYGDDVGCVGRRPIDALLRETLKRPGANAFNTLGFIKSVRELKLGSSQWVPQTDGIWVRKSLLAASS